MTWHGYPELLGMAEVSTKEPRDSEPDDAQLGHTSALKARSVSSMSGVPPSDSDSPDARRSGFRLASDDDLII
jgi:hypothetical protein